MLSVPAKPIAICQRHFIRPGCTRYSRVACPSGPSIEALCPAGTGRTCLFTAVGSDRGGATGRPGWPTLREGRPVSHGVVQKPLTSTAVAANETPPPFSTMCRQPIHHLLLPAAQLRPWPMAIPSPNLLAVCCCLDLQHGLP